MQPAINHRHTDRQSGQKPTRHSINLFRAEDFLYDRNGICRSFSWSCPGSSKNVFALQSKWYCFFLYWQWILPAKRSHCLHTTHHIMICHHWSGHLITAAQKQFAHLQMHYLCKYISPLSPCAHTQVHADLMWPWTLPPADDTVFSVLLWSPFWICCGCRNS